MVGISDTSIGRILLGRWVKTIVLSSPKRRGWRGAARNESAESRLAPKMSAPSISRFASKRRWKKSASRVSPISPPANASTLKSAASGSALFFKRLTL
jgi:hypothetical protein